MNKKISIYQVLPRLFGNNNTRRVPNGTLQQNGCGKFKDFTYKTLQEIKNLGITHIWYTGVIEHASQTDYSSYGIQASHPAIVKGKAGSPYAITDYYSVAPDLATDVSKRMQEFQQLIHRTHKSDLKVIIDFIPNHVARSYHSTNTPSTSVPLGDKDNEELSFSTENNFYYLPNTILSSNTFAPQYHSSPYIEQPAKATGNDRFDPYPTPNDWYETIKLNYGVDYLNGQQHFSPIPATWNQMRDILLFWAEKGVDGFRCDMAEMVPVEFWNWVIPQVKKRYKELIFIAEVYTPSLYSTYLTQGKFDYLYDKVRLYDTLRAIITHTQPASAITSSWQSLNGLEKKMLNFIENHDEQRVASTYFAGDPQKAVPALLIAACLNTNPVMIYFGQELGEEGMCQEGFSGLDGRTSIFDYWSVDKLIRWRNRNKFDGKLLTDEEKRIRKTYQKILNIASKEKAISKGLFFDLMYVNMNGWRFNADKQFSFFRKHEEDLLLISVNFDAQPASVAINLPSHAFDYLQIPQYETIKAIELLTNREESISLLPYRATEIKIPAYGGTIHKIKINNL